MLHILPMLLGILITESLAAMVYDRSIGRSDAKWVPVIAMTTMVRTRLTKHRASDKRKRPNHKTGRETLG